MIPERPQSRHGGNTALTHASPPITGCQEGHATSNYGDLPHLIDTANFLFYELLWTRELEARAVRELVLLARYWGMGVGGGSGISWIWCGPTHSCPLPQSTWRQRRESSQPLSRPQAPNGERWVKSMGERRILCPYYVSIRFAPGANAQLAFP